MSASRPTLAHRLEFALYRGVERLLGALSMADCVWLGHGLGTLVFALSPKYRHIVRRNLRVVTAAEAPDAARLDALVRETFRRVGANFLASLKTAALPQSEVGEHFDAGDFQILTNHHRDGVGTVVALPHMGNWEALPQLQTSFPSGGIYRPLDNPLVDAVTRRRRTAAGTALFSRKEGFHAPAAFLREGGALAVLSDQRAGGRGAAMPFFGKMTTCSPLPELLARRGRARVVALSVITAGRAAWRLRVHPVKTVTTAEIMRATEIAIRDSPTDVFWLHDRWRVDSRLPLSLFTRIDPEVAATATVPLRVLLTTPPDAPEADIQALLETMFARRPDLRVDRLATPAAETRDERVILHDWDPTTPREQLDGFLQRLDDAHPAPLDAALFFGSEPDLARAARRRRLRCIVGLDVSGKSWTHTFPAPENAGDWRELAEALAAYPTRNRR